MGQDPFGLVGTTVEERFRVDALVGEGGFGVVYRGYHLSFRQNVAVKVLKVPTHFTAAARDLFLDKFREEGEHLAKLSEHRSVVRVFDFGTTATASGVSAPYLVLDWLEGRSLDAHMAARAKAGLPLPSEDEVVEFLRPVIDAIAFAHRLSIAHRDLKPANIFVADTALGQVPKVLDFGIAKAMQEGESATVLATNTTSGFGAFSPPYGAPEQFLRKRYGATGPWTDVYALGLVIVELLTGRRPYDGDEQPEFFLAATNASRPTARTRGREVSDELEAVCAKALALMPEDRYQSAGELLAALPPTSLPAGVVPLALAEEQDAPSAGALEITESADTEAFLEAMAARGGTAGRAARSVAQPRVDSASDDGSAAAAPTLESGATDGDEPRAEAGAPGRTEAAAPASSAADGELAAAGATERPGSAPRGETERPEPGAPRAASSIRAPSVAKPEPAAPSRGKLTATVGGALAIAAVAALIWQARTPPEKPTPEASPVSEGGAGVQASAAATVASATATASGAAARAGRCPADMVRIAERFCIDRYEAILVDRDSGERLSPYYSPSRANATAAEKAAKEVTPDAGADAQVPLAATMPVPELPAWQRSSDPVPKAMSVGADVPNAMVASKHAETACANAGKRLCSREEWRTACAGEAGTKFPYGDEFRHGVCNIFTEAHPTGILYGNASIGHTDPRVNLVESNGRTLLAKTGENRGCRSRWGADAVYDMVGNLMEWVTTPDGLAAVGGYYAQSSRNGCEMSTGSALGFGFANYTTGVRCCADLEP